MTDVGVLGTFLLSNLAGEKP